MLRILLAPALLLPLGLWAQNAAEPVFEVAVVKANRMEHPQDEFRMLPSGLVRIRHASLRDLVQGAWNLEDYAIAGGSGWIEGDYFDVFAKAAPNTPAPVMDRMLQNLLKERLKL